MSILIAIAQNLPREIVSWQFLLVASVVCTTTMITENFHKMPQIGISLPIQPFAVAKENFENCLHEKPHTDTSLPIQFFTIVDRNSENHFCKMLHICIH